MFWFILEVFMAFVKLFIWFYILLDLISAVKTRKCQKKWNEMKAKFIKIDPAITRAELCEQYVLFCKRNDCKVEF